LAGGYRRRSAVDGEPHGLSITNLIRVECLPRAALNERVDFRLKQQIDRD
jgi:hypothetical protein